MLRGSALLVVKRGGSCADTVDTLEDGAISRNGESGGSLLKEKRKQPKRVWLATCAAFSKSAMIGCERVLDTSCGKNLGLARFFYKRRDWQDGMTSSNILEQGGLSPGGVRRFP